MGRPYFEMFRIEMFPRNDHIEMFPVTFLMSERITCTTWDLAIPINPINHFYK